jgi:hypothetical protein
LARNANIVHSKAFEMGFVKFLSDLESDLLSDPVERKIWQRTQEVRAFQYMDLHMAPLSLIVCERLFSRAGRGLCGTRRNMPPRKSGTLMFLHSHMKLWDLNMFHQAILKKKKRKRPTSSSKDVETRKNKFKPFMERGKGNNQKLM